MHFTHFGTETITNLEAWDLVPTNSRQSTSLSVFKIKISNRIPKIARVVSIEGNLKILAGKKKSSFVEFCSFVYVIIFLFIYLFSY